MKYLKFSLLFLQVMATHPHLHHLESSPIENEIFYAGIVCITFAIVLLWFNERKAAINSFRLQHARESCITITPY